VISLKFLHGKPNCGEVVKNHFNLNLLNDSVTAVSDIRHLLVFS